MTQYDIYRFLKHKSNELFTSEEIAIHLNTNKQCITSGLRKLRRIFPICKLSRNHGKTMLYAYSEDLNNHMKDKRKAQWNINNTTMKKII